MGVFQTKVYKECYPFSREVLYNTEKRKLIIHLLEFRNPDLVYGSKKKAMITGRKLRKHVLVAVDEELDKIDEIYTYIENREYAKVDGIYMNWLLKLYKSRIRCFLGIGLYMPYQCFQLFE